MATFTETMKSARLRHSGSDLKREGKRFREILALSLIASALVIGACILGVSGRGLYIGGASIEGGFGLVLGAAMLVFVFVKSWRYIK